MPVTTITQDANHASRTTVTVTWSTGETIRYTIAPNPSFDGPDADSFEDCMAYNVYITGYACPEDGVDCMEWDITDSRAECATQCETEAEAIEFCSECH